MPSTVGIVASGVAGFSPLDLSPALWLDAADTSTITESSGSVSQWNDKSSSGYNVGQSTGANQPKTGTVSQNGLNVIDFDGNDYLNRGAWTSPVSNTLGQNVTGMTIYVVRNWGASPSAAREIFRFDTGVFGGASRALIGGGNTANKNVAGGRTLDANSFAFAASSANVDTATWQIQTGLYDIANTDLYLYVNSTEVGSNTSYQTATTTSNTASRAIAVGAASTGGAPFTGQIAEIIVYHAAHDATQRQQVWDYLNAKWGL